MTNAGVDVSTLETRNTSYSKEQEKTKFLGIG